MIEMNVRFSIQYAAFTIGGVTHRKISFLYVVVISQVKEVIYDMIAYFFISPAPTVLLLRSCCWVVGRYEPYRSN